MANEPFADNQDQPKVTFRPSAHKFTDPIRLFKSNDPYYWKVDNIALEELSDNVLWLKDQVGSDAAADGVKRSDINELRPTVAGNDRAVNVSPGNFLARVNDAVGTGISTFVQDAIASILNNDVKSQLTFTLTDAVLSKLIGDITNSPIYNNGLYDHLQHHTTGPISNGSYSIDWGALHTAFSQNDKSTDGVYDIPKLKLALWKQASTVQNYTESQVDLQQLSVEFTRRWGAPFRTAMVNVASTLSIDVPEFADADFVNNSTYVPATRVDLLFIYSKPIDASSTTIAKATGNQPTKITTPQLGLVKGAGVISLNGAGSVFGGKTIDPDFLASADYTGNKDNPANYFDASGAVDGNGNPQINAPVADTAQSEVGINGVYGAFPSPDDLMNLAPLIAEGVAATSNALVGQTVLPIAYIFVRKGQTVLTSDDIIDIRPFFRTTELTYNERAGVAGAVPPLSLANPAVGKAELHNTAKQLRDFALANSVEVPEYPRPVAGGMVFGGLNWGVEGSILRMGADSHSPFANIADVGNSQEILDWFKLYAGLPPTTNTIPTLPDWDVAKRMEFADNAGGHRNDRINVVLNRSDHSHYQFSRDSEVTAAYDSRVSQTISHSYGQQTGLLHAYCVKRINIDKSLVPWMVDYDVIPHYVNCVPFTNKDRHMNHSDNADQQTFAAFAGLHVEKYDDHFDIIASWEIPDPWKGSGDVIDQRFGSWGNRDNGQWSGHMATHEAGRFLQPTTTANTWSDTYSSNMAFSISTYPTVKFTVMGYPPGFSMNTDLGNNNNIVFSS